MTLVPIGRLEVATPETMALAVREGTQAQRAVDERVSIGAAAAVAAQPTVVAAAAAAVSSELVDGGLKKTTLQQVLQMQGGSSLRNLFEDPGSEYTPGALVSSGAGLTVSQSTQWGEEGKSWMLSYSTATAVSAAAAKMMPLGGATTVTVGARFFNWLGETRGLKVGAAFYNASNVSTGAFWGDENAVPSGGRQYVWGTFAVPAGSTQMKMTVVRSADGVNLATAADSLFVTNIYVGEGVERPVLPLDGDQALTYWDGVKGQSASVRIRPVNSDSATKSLLTEGAAWGDSMVENPWVEKLGTLTGVSWYNGGKSGQTSGIIAFRQGGAILQTLEQITLPATGAVTVKVRASFTPFVYANSGTVPGVLDGTAVTFTQVSGKHATGEFTISVTRSATGTARVIGVGATLRSTEGDLMRDRKQLFWTGRNDTAFGAPHHVGGVLAADLAMRAYLTPVIKRALVLSVVTTTVEGSTATGGNATSRKAVLAINAARQAASPNDYVDVRRYLIDNALRVLAITPTAADNAAILADTIPPSITVDGTHLTTACREQVLAPFIAREERLRGWA